MSYCQKVLITQGLSKPNHIVQSYALMSLHLQRLSGPYFKVEDLYHLDLSYYRSWSTSDDCLKNDLTWDYSPDQVLNEDLNKSKVIKTLQICYFVYTNSWKMGQPWPQIYFRLFVQVASRNLTLRSEQKARMLTTRPLPRPWLAQGYDKRHKRINLFYRFRKTAWVAMNLRNALPGSLNRPKFESSSAPGNVVASFRSERDGKAAGVEPW